MKKIKFLNTELSVAPLCLGTVNYGSAMPEKEAIHQLSRYVELGGNFIDTAHIYGNEAAVGRAVRDSDVPREEISIHDDHLTQIVKAIRRDLKIKDKAYPQINLKK